MTKKDFILVARVMRVYSDAFKANEAQISGYKVTGSSLIREITYKLGNEFITINPRFDFTKFNEACGIN